MLYVYEDQVKSMLKLEDRVKCKGVGRKIDDRNKNTKLRKCQPHLELDLLIAGATILTHSSGPFVKICWFFSHTRSVSSWI